MACVMIARRNSSMYDGRGTNEADIGLFCCLTVLLLGCVFTLCGFGIFGRVNTKGASTAETRW